MLSYFLAKNLSDMSLLRCYLRTYVRVRVRVRLLAIARLQKKYRVGRRFLPITS